MGTTSIIWFRKGLRLHDNPALLAAAQGADHLCPLFILDPWFLQPDKIGVNRVQFLLESLADLDASFRARGSRLLVLRGKPQEVLPRVFKEWGVTRLCFESDTEPYANQRDATVRQLAETAGVEVHSPVSHTLYDPQLLLARNGGKPPLTMQAFTKLVDAVGPPPAPAADPPEKLPPLAPQAASLAAAACSVPSLSDIGYPPAGSTPFKGGETEALARMADYLSDKDWVCAFEKPKGNPALFLRPATTVLSPYLKFGCLSPRMFHAKLQQIYSERSGKHTQPPVSLRGQLLWREFFTLCGAAIPNFDRMEGNPICRQIPWVDDADFIQAWEESRTGYPWIDAIMAQLRQQGWMHHLARHSVACFLTRGDLWCSWEAGQAVFDKYLIDADWSLNAANWQWLSASAFFSQYFRVYSPISFGKQYDKNGDYIRHFLPVLKNMPAKYIYEPWTAPLSVQQAAGCIIGKDYPRPIVDHATVHKENMAKMKAAYDAGKAAAAGHTAAAATAAAAAGADGASGSASGSTAAGGKGGGKPAKRARKS
ncbi:hypothetical protein COHA_006460 [Chlorella ohadii]|uniref:Photolyase/cryptochrome alpha/beta domain-containing protein n=1 Tax=Chlorella ohadii TaxID=2649997 RepID=A0AAD5DMF8_9CHLO|nr:hypothetical protein COHA_006460 [Chlorella ohadii]